MPLKVILKCRIRHCIVQYCGKPIIFYVKQRSVDSVHLLYTVVYYFIFSNLRKNDFVVQPITHERTKIFI